MEIVGVAGAKDLRRRVGEDKRNCWLIFSSNGVQLGASGPADTRRNESRFTLENYS